MRATPHSFSPQVEAEHKAWMAKYTPFAQKVFADRAHRIDSRRRNAKLRRPPPHNSYRPDSPSLSSPDFILDLLNCDLRGFTLGYRADFGLAFCFMIVPSCITLWLVVWLCTRLLDRFRCHLRRPIYYKRENERRRALAAARRKIKRRTTTNRCPTKEEILDAYLAIKRSHEAVIRFGGLIEDLECYLDNSLRRNEKGEIIGRRSGIKGWLQENIPALYARYTTVMRYKATAKKLRQIMQIEDPTPVSAILDAKGSDDVPELRIVKAVSLWHEVTKNIASNPTALVRRINCLLDPNCVEAANMLDSWRRNYAQTITERTKKRWWKAAKKIFSA